MDYVILPQSLHETANAAIVFMHDNWGVPKKTVKVEQIIDPKLNYRPTLNAIATDHHIICIDVSESPYSNSLDSFVQDCVSNNFPVKLYVAIPRNLQDTVDKSQLRRAKDNGVGIIEVDTLGGSLIHDSIPLSLAKVRPINLKSVPPKYREALWRAENTFRSGSPDKGCALLFDEMEALFRRVAVKLNEKKFWLSRKKIALDYENGSWASLIEHVQKNLDKRRCNCPELKPAFLARIHGFTQYRNETGHKPHSRAALIKRDRELRTRFEAAADTLLDLLANTKALHL